VAERLVQLLPLPLMRKNRIFAVPLQEVGVSLPSTIKSVNRGSPTGPHV
jgi:hypothetical protein